MLESADSSRERVVYFLDLATYHRSKTTMAELQKLGLNVLFNSPENPCLNTAELFIRASKAKIKAKRSEVR